MQLQENDIITFLVHDIGVHGEGIGNYEGMTIFIEGALPGEKVQGKIITRKQKYCQAKLLHIKHPCRERVQPPCPYYDKCGGCQIMHMSYEGQLKIKTKRVQDAIIRIAKIKNLEVMPCVPSDEEFAYRNKIQLPITQDKQLGLYQKRSHSIVPIDHCIVHQEIGEEIFHHVQALISKSSIAPYDETTGKGELRHVIIRSTKQTAQALVGFVTTMTPSHEVVKIASSLMQQFSNLQGVIHIRNTSNTNKILSSVITTLKGKNEVIEQLDDLKFSYSLQSFFQINPSQAASIYLAAVNYANISKEDTILDAFCGVGTLALFFAKYAKQAWGIECVDAAIQNAKKNARINNIKNASFMVGEIENHIQRFLNIDWVILNPPRKGCSDSCLKGVLKIKPKGIIYMSCDPATLSRDLYFLTTNGFSVEMVQPFDMFPQTMHVETLCILKRL